MGGSSFNSSTKKYSQNGERCLFKGFGRSLFSKPSKSSQTIGKSFSKLDAKWSYGAPISRVIAQVTHLNPTYNDPRGSVSCTLFGATKHPPFMSFPSSLGSDWSRYDLGWQTLQQLGILGHDTCLWHLGMKDPFWAPWEI